MHRIEEGEEYLCPSFNSYSSDRLPEIAAKISDEFKRGISEEEEYANDEFEFTLAKEFFYDGQSGRFFPVFNPDLIINGDFPDHGRVHDEIDSSICIAMSNCSVNEKVDREPPPPPRSPPSSSESESDELESAPSGTYCLWRPKRKETTSSQSRCKKSNSTGSTSFKQWKLRDLLRRSNSEGKDSYVFISPKKLGNSEGIESDKALKLTGKSKAKKITAGAHEEFYVRSRAAKERVKRKSYLPYRQDLLGFFANVNALGRTLPSF